MDGFSNKDGRRAMPPLEIDRSLAFRHPVTIEAFAYWRSLLDGRTMPTRADLDLKTMRRWLPHVALVEPRREADGTYDYYIRLAGTLVEETYGQVSGKRITEFLSPELQTRWRSVMDRLVEWGTPLRSIGPMAFGNRTWLEVEYLCAPLGADGKTVQMILVVLAFWEAGKLPAE